MNPHCLLSRIVSPLEPIPDIKKDLWICHWCGDAGSFDELESRNCGYEYPICPWCGQTPICAPDCVGCWLALSDPKIYIAGEKKEGVKDE